MRVLCFYNSRECKPIFLARGFAVLVMLRRRNKTFASEITPATHARLVGMEMVSLVVDSVNVFILEWLIC